MPRPQFSLRTLFILTAVVAVACVVGPPVANGVLDRPWTPELLGELAIALVLWSLTLWYIAAARSTHSADLVSRRWYNAPMRRPRTQFRLSTLLWITLAVACFLAGNHWNRHELRRELQMAREQWEVERALFEFQLANEKERFAELNQQWLDFFALGKAPAPADHLREEIPPTPLREPTRTKE